jgi:Flp pilus assembly protein CpaB
VKRSNRLVILVGVLLAVLAFVGIVILLNSTPREAETLKTKVLVATEPIDIGEEVTPDKVEVADVDPGDVIGQPFGSETQVSGQRAIYAIPEGSQVPKDALGLGQIGNVCIECQLLPGEKAIAFQVDRVTGLNFLVQTGDHLDIVLAQGVAPLQETEASITARQADPDLPPRYEVVAGISNVRTVKTILTDKRVLYVSATNVRSTAVQATPSPGQQQQQAAAAEIDTVIIVIAGTDQDAELIKFAQTDLNELGFLTAVIRRVKDTEEGVPQEVTTGITLDILIDQYDVPIPNVVLIPLPSPAP